MKDVLMLTHFTHTPGEKGNSRFDYLARLLSETTCVELVTTTFSHRNKAPREISPEQRDALPYTLTMLHEPGYQKNVSLTRFYSHYRFGKAVQRYLQTRKKPDLVYCAVPSLKAALVAAKYCKKNHIKFIIDIQDLWPEAFKMVLRIPVVSDVLFSPLQWMANEIYKRADAIVAVSDSYVERALSVNNTCTQGLTVYLGTRLATYDEGAAGEPLYKKPEHKIWIGYCGSLAASYDIPNLMRAVKRLQEKGIKDIELILIGEGTHRQQFETVAKELHVDAVFTGRLSYEQMCAQLNECDIVVNPIKHGSAASIINKHGDYAASGLPVVNSQDSREYRDLIDQYKMGLNCNNEDAEDMAQKLEQLITNKSLRLEMGKNARRCAEERFDRDITYKAIQNLIEN